MPPRNYELAAKIRQLCNDGLNQTAIAKLLGCTQTNISQIARRNNIIFARGAGARDQRGEKNPFYKNGLSKSSIERLTRRILLETKRNLYTCESCGNINGDQEHHRHHKDRDRSNNKPSNLEVLCGRCHMKEHNVDRLRDLDGTFKRDLDVPF